MLASLNYSHFPETSVSWRIYQKVFFYILIQLHGNCIWHGFDFALKIILLVENVNITIDPCISTKHQYDMYLYTAQYCYNKENGIQKNIGYLTCRFHCYNPSSFRALQISLLFFLDDFLILFAVIIIVFFQYKSTCIFLTVISIAMKCRYVL